MTRTKLDTQRLLATAEYLKILANQTKLESQALNEKLQSKLKSRQIVSAKAHTAK